MSRTETFLINLFGIVCTMNVIFWGLSISNYILFGLLLYKFVNSGIKIRLNIGNMASRFVVCFAVSIFISILVARSYLPSEWINNSISCGVKYAVLFLFVFLLYDSNALFRVREVFLRGFFVGSIIQMIWGYLQISLYFLFGFKLNTFVFQEMFRMTGYNWDSYISGGILRMKGLGWETANFALTMIIGYILASKYRKQANILRLLFVVAVLFSTSRSGYVTMIAVLLYESFLRFLKIKKVMLTLRKFIGLVVVIGVISLGFIFYGDILYDRITLVIKSLLSMFDTSVHDSSNSIHISYYTNLPHILKNIGPVKAFLGCGYMSSGYVYSSFDSFLAYRFNLLGWNPESDFITLIIGNGLFGFLLYYIFAARAFFNHWKDEYGLIIIAVLCLGITYLIIRGSWSFLLLVFTMLDDRRQIR